MVLQDRQREAELDLFQSDRFLCLAGRRMNERFEMNGCSLPGGRMFFHFSWRGQNMGRLKRWKEMNGERPEILTHAEKKLLLLLLL